MTKQQKIYTITCDRGRGTPVKITGTLPELIQSHSYTLECGKSYEHEKGNKKINLNPKSIGSLVTNLYNASNNAAANGYSGKSYSFK